MKRSGKCEIRQIDAFYSPVSNVSEGGLERCLVTSLFIRYGCAISPFFVCSKDDWKDNQNKQTPLFTTIYLLLSY